MNADELKQRLLKVRILFMDVDGVLTDGRVVIDNYGDELKFFDSTDGLGIVLLRKAGIVSAIISSKKSKANQRRAKDLGIHVIYQDVRDKREVFEKVLTKYQMTPDEACVVGDDLVDIPMMSKAGVSVAVQNATRDVKCRAHYVTTKSGGRGAVRETAEMILKAQDKWSLATQDYLV